MASNTDLVSELTQYQVDLISTNAGFLGVPILGSGEPSVFYGDQTLIPVTPTICVESGPLDRDIGEGGFRSLITFTTFFMIYHAKIQDEQVNKKQCDQFAEAVTDVLHSDKTMSGLVIHGWVNKFDPGIAKRQNELLRATRLTWTGISKAGY